MNSSIPGTHPHYSHDFTVRMGEVNREGKVGIAAVCGYLQEVATWHAALLGFGLRDLIATGRTWMLSHLTVEAYSTLEWNNRFTLQTWPSGTRGSLVATRDFIGRDAQGHVIIAATSEWLFVDTSAGKIVRLPETLTSRVSPDTPRVALSEAPPPDPKEWPVAHSEKITVRHSDIDVNRHANNTRYVDWMFEPLTETKGMAQPNRIEIFYKLGATDTDIVLSAVSREEDGIIRHRLTRESDGATFAVAVSRWGR